MLQVPWSEISETCSRPRFAAAAKQSVRSVEVSVGALLESRPGGPADRKFNFRLTQEETSLHSLVKAGLQPASQISFC